MNRKIQALIPAVHVRAHVRKKVLAQGEKKSIGLTLDGARPTPLMTILGYMSYDLFWSAHTTRFISRKSEKQGAAAAAGGGGGQDFRRASLAGRYEWYCPPPNACSVREPGWLYCRFRLCWKLLRFMVRMEGKSQCYTLSRGFYLLLKKVFSLEE